MSSQPSGDTATPYWPSDPDVRGERIGGRGGGGAGGRGEEREEDGAERMGAGAAGGDACGAPRRQPSRGCERAGARAGPLAGLGGLGLGDLGEKKSPSVPGRRAWSSVPLGLPRVFPCPIRKPHCRQRLAENTVPPQFGHLISCRLPRRPTG